MSSSSSSVNDLAHESLAQIFAFLPPDERVRLERVCKKWRQVAPKHAWTEFKTMSVDKNELEQRGCLALAKYQGLIDRCGPHLRELRFAHIGKYTVEQWTMLAKYRGLIDRSVPQLRQLRFAELRDYNMEQWTKLRNLRHLRFDMDVGSDTLRALADNLKCLQSVHFSVIDGRSAAGMHELLRVDNASLQALRIPVSDSRWESLHLSTLPSSLRLLHINDDSLSRNRSTWSSDREREQTDELLGVAVSCCPQLAMLMLPIFVSVSKQSLSKLASFEKLFYLRLNLNLSDVNLFGNSLEKIGPQLKALFLEEVDSAILHLIAKHCPNLEHCSFGIKYPSVDHATVKVNKIFRTRLLFDPNMIVIRPQRFINWDPEIIAVWAFVIGAESAGLSLLSALQSVFQLAHLRSVSIHYSIVHHQAQFLGAINGLNTKGKLEYLHLSRGLPLTAEFVRNLIQLNPKLRKLTCAIWDGQTPAELGVLQKLLQNMDRPMELELFEQCPPELEMENNSKIRVRVRADHSPERISQPMLREFWARAMDSVPNLGNLDD